MFWTYQVKDFVSSQIQDKEIVVFDFQLAKDIQNHIQALLWPL